MSRLLTTTLFVMLGMAAGVVEAAESPPVNIKILKTEIIVTDNWTITCTLADQPKAKRHCNADLKIVQSSSTTQRVVFNWRLTTQDGKLISLVAAPSGVQIGPGVQMKIGDKEPRKFNYSACWPDHCEAIVSLDDSMSKMLSGTPTVDFIVQAVNGTTMQFTVNMKGFEEASAAVSGKD